MQVKTQRSNKSLSSQSTLGFTLLENILVVAIIGILSAIAAPNWNAFINRQRLNTAQHQVYRAMQEAKSQAMLQKGTWQFSVREVTLKGQPVVQWAVHPKSVNPNSVPWQTLDSHIHLYPQETTLYKDKKNAVQRVQFNYIGNTNGQLGQITLSTSNNGRVKRCVYISTLIGTMRMGREHPKPNSSKKYCY